MEVSSEDFDMDDYVDLFFFDCSCLPNKAFCGIGRIISLIKSKPSKYNADLVENDMEKVCSII